MGIRLPSDFPRPGQYIESLSRLDAMIAKRVHCQPQNDRIKRIGLYIAGANHEGEKLFAKWTAGCYAGQDYNLAIDEIKATQELNTRTTKEKTYHLVVSFHPDDFKKLSLTNFQDIEKEFAKALGFEDHQRLCGMHINTDNPHMHIAYNMIHKEKFTRHDPFFDYHKCDSACRDLEKEYNLKVDNGIKQQFSDYVKQYQPGIKEAFNNAENWQSLHKELAAFGVTVQLRGNGCILAAISHKPKAGHYIKLSEFDKSLSKKKLQDTLGKFEKPTSNYEIKNSFQREPRRENKKAKDFEIKTGLKSFDTFVLESKEFITQAAVKADNWQDFHKELSRIGLEVKPRGAGFIVADIGGKTKKKSSIPFSKTGLKITKNGIIIECQKKEGINDGRNPRGLGNRNRPARRQRDNNGIQQPGFNRPGQLSKNNLRNLSQCCLAHHGTGQVKDILSFNARSYRRKPESLRRGNNGRLKILGEFEASKGGYKIEKSYKFEPAKKFKSAQERDAWKIYIKDQKQYNHNWLKFNKNFKRFYGEDYGM